jgi:RimJ/RimL family protein N-acetyltransferase
MTMTIRTLQPDDAAQFAALMTHLDNETKFMLYEPGERQTTVAQWRERIEQLREGGESEVFVAEAEGELVGFLRAQGQTVRRLQHTLYLVIGLRAAYSGRGIGAQLFTVMESWARARNLRRLALTVMTHNERAIALYRKMGFEIEGRHTAAIMVDGVLVDEYTMAKILPAAEPV